MMKILVWPVSSFWCLPYSGSAFSCPDPTLDDNGGDDDDIPLMIIPNFQLWKNGLRAVLIDIRDILFDRALWFGDIECLMTKSVAVM